MRHGSGIVDSRLRSMITELLQDASITTRTSRVSSVREAAEGDVMRITAGDVLHKCSVASATSRMS